MNKMNLVMVFLSDDEFSGSMTVDMRRELSGTRKSVKYWCERCDMEDPGDDHDACMSCYYDSKHDVKCLTDELKDLKRNMIMVVEEPEIEPDAESEENECEEEGCGWVHYP